MSVHVCWVRMKQSDGFEMQKVKWTDGIEAILFVLLMCNWLSICFFSLLLLLNLRVDWWEELRGERWGLTCNNGSVSWLWLSHVSYTTRMLYLFSQCGWFLVGVGGTADLHHCCTKDQHVRSRQAYLVSWIFSISNLFHPLWSYVV